MIELKNSKTTYLGKAPDGKRNRFRLECHIGAIQMREDGRDWEDIDPTLDRNGLPQKVPYIVTPYLTGMPGFHYKSKQSGEFDVRLRQAKSISLRGLSTIVAPTIPIPIIVGKQIIWRDAYPDTDVVLQFGNTKVSLKRILKSAKAPTEYDIDSEVIEEGIAQILPIRPARDANNQLLIMEEAKIDGGRTERLILKIIPFKDIEPQLITYPIEDPYDIEETIGASSDDAEQDGGVMTLDGDSVFVGNTDDWGGFRFTGVNIPAGATVDTAFMHFYCGPYSQPIDYIHCEDGNNPGTFTTDANNISGRSLTAAKITWNPGSEIGDSQWHDTASLVDLVQEVIDNNAGTGDALIIIWDHFGTPNMGIIAWDYDDHSLASQLFIDYTAAVEGISIPVVMYHLQQMKKKRGSSHWI